LRAMDDLQRAGKVRYIGASNYNAWQLVESLWKAESYNTIRYDTLQPKYNLVTRAEFERDLLKVCEKYQVGVIPYSPLAAGFLTGKYERNQTSSSKRSEGVQKSFATETGWRTLEAVKAVAQELDTTPGAVSLAWLLNQPVITAPIIGANSPEQLHQNLVAVDIKLSEDQVQRLNEASKWH
jgi:aryl-alcohol dehydrogenase-like predicted oxidoreductase